MKEYVGIIEDNGNEGETFGWYFESTPETVALVQQVESKVLAETIEVGDNSYEFEYNTTEDELTAIDKFDRNGYMARVNKCDSDFSLDSLRKLATVGVEMPYKGSFGTAYDDDQPIDYVDLR